MQREASPLAEEFARGLLGAVRHPKAPPPEHPDGVAWLPPEEEQCSALRSAQHEAASKWGTLLATEEVRVGWRARALAEMGALVTPEDRERLIGGYVVETPAIEAVRLFLASGAQALVLCGPPGVGKSFAGQWGLLERYRDPVAQAQMGEAADAVQHGEEPGADALTTRPPVGVVVRAALVPRLFHPLPHEAPRAMFDWCHSTVLVDDLGAEGAFGQSERFLRDMELFLELRATSADCRTIITTNLSAAELVGDDWDNPGRYTARFRSRLLGSAYLVDVGGEDLRVTPANEGAG